MPPGALEPCETKPISSGADDTADEVDADHVEGVVHAELELQADRPGAERAGDGADDDRADEVDRATGRGDRDQAGHDARRGAERGGLAVQDPLHEQPAEHRGHGGDRGVEEGHPGLGHELGDVLRLALAGAEDDRADVEAVPAEPQQARADHGQREVVRLHRLLAEADPLADDQRQHQAGHTGVDVHDRATGVVLGAGKC